MRKLSCLSLLCLGFVLFLADLPPKDERLAGIDSFYTEAESLQQAKLPPKDDDLIGRREVKKREHLFNILARISGFLRFRKKSSLKFEYMDEERIQRLSQLDVEEASQDHEIPWPPYPQVDLKLIGSDW